MIQLLLLFLESVIVALAEDAAIAVETAADRMRKLLLPLGRRFLTSRSAKMGDNYPVLSNYHYFSLL
jgi:hypothetical protein